MQVFQMLSKELGVPLGEEKLEGLCTAITYLGIKLDTIQQSRRLPQGKLIDIRIQIWDLLHCAKVTLKELQEVVGHLNFVCKVISLGRAFLRWLCEARGGLSKPHYRWRLSAGMKEDLMVSWRSLTVLMEFQFGGMRFVWEQNSRSNQTLAGHQTLSLIHI